MQKQISQWCVLITVLVGISACQSELESTEIVRQAEAELNEYEVDLDNDLVPDFVDQCVGSQEDRDGFQDHDGCPDVAFKLQLLRDQPCSDPSDPSCNAECFGNQVHPAYCYVVPFQDGMHVDYSPYQGGQSIFDGVTLPDFRLADFNMADNATPLPVLAWQGAVLFAIDTPSSFDASMAIPVGLLPWTRVLPGAGQLIGLVALTYIITTSTSLMEDLRPGVATRHADLNDLVEFITDVVNARTRGCRPCSEQMAGPPPNIVHRGTHCHWPCGWNHQHEQHWVLDARDCSCRAEKNGNTICEDNDTRMCCGDSWGVPCEPNKRPKSWNDMMSGSSSIGGTTTEPSWTPPHTNQDGVPITWGDSNWGPGSQSNDRRNWTFNCEGSGCEGYPCTSPLAGQLYGTESDCYSYIALHCNGAPGQCTSTR